MLDADVTDSVIGEGCVIMTEADKRFLAANSSVPIDIGRNLHIKRAIIDKNARIGGKYQAVSIDIIPHEPLMAIMTKIQYNEGPLGRLGAVLPQKVRPKVPET
ncbi:hypothetical protein PIB30_107672 [Stylosanthes scabra]|uniref:Uncharacterized protein n=1 Tax=Stylosanthes scabra TaxID=79078 RepID=A0ABU6RZP3_9FABA|nr:hypothetical protein [Stylosanthes scabra]